MVISPQKDLSFHLTFPLSGDSTVNSEGLDCKGSMVIVS